MKYEVKNASIFVDGDTLIDYIDFEIKENSHIGIVGKNGAGKTTLLNALIHPDNFSEGLEDIPFQIKKIGKFTIGYLKQVEYNDNNTLEEELLTVFEEIINVEKKIKSLESNLTNDKNITLYTNLIEHYKYIGGYTYKKEYEVMLNKFGFRDVDKSKHLKDFSGGQKTKIGFMKLLLQKPDILFLDEPTNHLDITAITYLEDYLTNYKKAFVIVSHDRMFLNNTVNTIYNIENKQVTKYIGNYEFFEKERERLYEKALIDYENQQKEIKRLRELYEKFRGKPTKAKMALSKLHQIEKMNIIDKPLKLDNKAFSFKFKKVEIPKNVLSISNLSFGYNTSLGCISLDLYKEDRLGIIGFNGCGKSTLLKTIIGKLNKLSGNIKFGYNINIGYFDQKLSMINNDNTILEELIAYNSDLLNEEARKLLGLFLFHQNDVNTKVKDLSGGEKVKLLLCKILSKNPNLLILDEPTNHLDIISKKRLEDILSEYKGALIIVSHDRYFIKKVTNKLLVFEDKINLYNYGYDEYIEKLKSKDSNTTNVVSKKQNKKVTINHNNIKKDIKVLENQITKLEEEKQKLNNDLLDPNIYSDYEKANSINQEIININTKLDDLNKKWEQLATKILEN